MKTLVVLSTLLAASLAFPSLPKPQFASGRIIGGVNALPGEFPFIVSIQWVFLTSSQHVCGGSIINNFWILTAAHCITESPNLGRLEILSGKLNLAITEPHQARLGIASNVIHENWVPGAVGPFDIAMMRLSASLVFNPWTQPITLPVPGSHPSGASVIMGWGNTATGTIPNNPDILQKAPVPIVSYDDCRSALADLNADDVFHADKICTGPLTGGISACSGDSGSPVVQGNTQVGIVSWGFIPCGQIGAPSVHTRVSQFVAWVNNIAVN